MTDCASSEDRELEIEYWAVESSEAYARGDLVTRAGLLLPLIAREYHEVLDLLA